MSNKLQCQSCHRAEFDEELYEYDGEILCRPCIVARVTESTIPCEYVGTCNDKTYKSKDQHIKDLQKMYADYKKENIDLKAENKRLKEELQNPHDVWVENNRLTEINNWQNNEITKLNKQLKEKEEEIEFISKTHRYRFDFRDRICQEVVISDEMLKIISKQFCNKIRGQITAHTGMAYHKGQKTISLTRLDKILHKIEKGEL